MKMKREIDSIDHSDTTDHLHTTEPSQKKKKPRKNDDDDDDDDATISSRFRDGLFEAPAVLDEFARRYRDSEPYRHGVIPNLLSPSLVRSVRSEIREHLSFSPKETDIYKIHQSGDLANLDGLDDPSLSRLPSLLKLRDALYSRRFRGFLSGVTGVGKLSGRKTDMAINVYTPGCHLLCHDDVIGSRRVSYILYLTDPEPGREWREEWGGALRLYPTVSMRRRRKKKGRDGEEVEEEEEVKVPSPDWTVTIPPAFNQLSFFAVQPGESFHDVEEVYHAPEGTGGEDDDDDDDGRRIRMAISGWFHVPQEGEDGYEEELSKSRETMGESSLSQLQGHADEFDTPQSHAIPYGDESEHDDLTEDDLDFLLRYLNPAYLTPDAAEELEERFGEDSYLTLDRILSDKFANNTLKAYIYEQEKIQLPDQSEDIEKSSSWQVARPPHKHRYLFQRQQRPSFSSPPPGNNPSDSRSPIQDLLGNLFPSRSFKKWLRLVTGCPTLLAHDFMARRFRKGQDYQLATNYDGDDPRLEITLGLTPDRTTTDPDLTRDPRDPRGAQSVDENGEPTSSPDDADDANADAGDGDGDGDRSVAEELGGYEVYMAGDDDDDDDDDDASDEDPNGTACENGADGAAESKKQKQNQNQKQKPHHNDPAVYRSFSTANDNYDDGGDDGILLSMPACWNKMSIVLRDKGTLKFVKYLSRKAPTDRWDITGSMELDWGD